MSQAKSRVEQRKSQGQRIKLNYESIHQAPSLYCHALYRSFPRFLRFLYNKSYISRPPRGTSLHDDYMTVGVCIMMPFGRAMIL